MKIENVTKIYEFQSHFGLILTSPLQEITSTEVVKFQSHFGLILTGRIFSLFGP